VPPGDNFIPNIKKTGKSTNDFVALKGSSDPATKPGVMITWLRKEFGLEHGQATAMTHAIKKSLRRAE